MDKNDQRTGSFRGTRRDALAAGLGLVAGLPMLGAIARAEPARERPSAAPSEPMSDDVHEAIMRPGKERIAIVLYPQFTALDVIGPHHVFVNMVGAKVLLVAKTREAVACDTGYAITPNATFEEIKDKQTLVMVPGGTSGTIEAMQDAATVSFLQRQGAEAEWIGSVCTGSLLLAAAGLLKGYKATSHWLARSALRAGGAEPVAARYVEDRNRVTGAGVTAGIDFALRLVQKWRGTMYAKGVQLFMEYDPQPPFNSGSPTSADADPAMVGMLEAMHESFGPKCEKAIYAALRSSQSK
ncbi:MAG: DJ-1/PfpI family protein [Phycisphaerales bacterium]|nr:DJ-1/PfpI family protein [Planctomycetota bacterium]